MNNSFYQEKLTDESSVYFTEDSFQITRDGLTDVTEQLQKAVNLVVEKYGYGVVFVPEGKYLLSNTIYVPKAVRIIGYGKNRPEFILKDEASGFNQIVDRDKGHFKYLFWFVDKMVTPEMDVNTNDANPGTFYSAMSNVNVRLGQGNAFAVAFRTHYAQHSFLAHIKIEVESGMAGIYDVGNEMEDVCIFGGKYGVITTKCSPGWPFVMVDTYFENQREAAIKTREAGLTIIRSHGKNVNKFVDVEQGYFEKVYIEDCVFENVETLLDMALDKNPLTQINIKNSFLKNGEIIAKYKDSGYAVHTHYQCAKINHYIHGIVSTNLNPKKENIDQSDIVEVNNVDYSILASDLKALPPMREWVNVKCAGMKGDGITDDTKALKDAIDRYDNLYFPQGEYLLSDTVKLKKNTAFIGMNPISTKLILKDNAEVFTGYGKGIPFIESGGDGKNILFGIGIDTGGKNPRAIGLKWDGCEDSYINDVKLFGGHGNLVKGTGEFEMPYNETRTADIQPERLWDYQYPSIVVTGGGIFKDVWSASPYASAGIVIENTETPGKIYCMSLEHHCRYELFMKNVKNWKLYGFQTEEEVAEGEFARPIEMHHCENVTFAMTYHFRTVFVNKPYDYCVKTFHCNNISFLNVHNFSQMKYTIDNYLLDVNTKTEIRTWQAAKIYISDQKERVNNIEEQPIKLFDGFRFADGGICDKKGNFYFVDSLDKKIFKIHKETLDIEQIFTSPYKVNSIGFDMDDRMIIVGEYVIPKGATSDGKPQENILPPDSYGTSYGFWYNKEASTIVFTLDNHGEMLPLPLVEMESIKPKKVLYPGNRWRDGSDYRDILSYNPKKAWIGEDGKTIVPMHYDLIRANNLSEAFPGEKFYSVDEMYKRVFESNVDENGFLYDSKVVIEEGDYCVRKYGDSILVGDDNIKIYKNGKIEREICVPSRPSTFDVGGEHKDIMFITARDGVYAVKLNMEEKNEK